MGICLKEEKLECKCVISKGIDTEHHSADCPKYHTEKFPYLLYYEDAIDAWTFAPDETENLLDVDSLIEGEEVSIRFVRKDMTDAEVAALPED